MLTFRPQSVLSLSLAAALFAILSPHAAHAQAPLSSSTQPASSMASSGAPSPDSDLRSEVEQLQQLVRDSNVTQHRFEAFYQFDRSVQLGFAALVGRPLATTEPWLTRLQFDTIYIF